jgi:hypothetical protein
VSLVHSADDLPAAVEALRGQRPFLVEEFVTGEEFSAEGLLIGRRVEVLSFTRKRTGAGFVETGHRTPSGLTPAVAASARETVARALTAVGVTHGIVHVEFWVTGEGRVVLGELHVRAGGDFIHLLVEHTRPGLELFGSLIDDLLGNPPAAIPEQVGAAGCEFLLLGPGRVRAVDGWEQAAGGPALLAAHLDIAPGDVLGPVCSSAGRHGVLVAGGPTPGDVEAALHDACDHLRIEVTAR